MKFSCIPLNFSREIGHDKTMSYGDWIKMAAEFGLDGVEIYEPWISGLDVAGKEQLADVLHGAGLEASMLTSESHLCHPDYRGKAIVI